MSSKANTAPRQGRNSVGLCTNSEDSVQFNMLARGDDELSCRSSIVDLLRASGGLFKLFDEPFSGLHLSLPRHVRDSFPLHHLRLQKLHSPRTFVDLKATHNTQHTPRGAPSKFATRVRLEKTVAGRGEEHPLCDRRPEIRKGESWRRRTKEIDVMRKK